MVAPVEADAGVYVVWQEPVPDPPLATLHVPWENEPPEPPSLHETVPKGVVGDVFVSVTVAVKVIELPAFTDDGLGETPVDVEWGGGLTVRDDVPELAACAKSPE